MLRWLSWVLVAAAWVAHLACSSAMPQVGGVRITTNVPEATLYVDEELRGPAGEYEAHYIRLSPGRHRLTLEHPDYFPEYLEVNVPRNMAMAVTMELRRRPDSPPKQLGHGG